MSAAPGPPTDALPAGRVGRAHGLDGRVRVTGPRPSLLHAGVVVTVAGTAREILQVAGTDEQPILRLEGVSSREAAEALRGQTLHVARGDAPELDEDEHRVEDLVGLVAQDRCGTTVGTVARVLDLPSCAVLVLAPAGGTEPGPGDDASDRELLVPLVRDAVPELDVEAGLLVLDTAFLGLEG